MIGFVLINWLLNSAHRFSIGLRSGDWDGHCRMLILLSRNHFCVDLEVCFGSLLCWKVHLWPGPRLLAEGTSWAFSQNCLILGGIHYAIYPSQYPIKTAPKHDWPTTIFHRSYDASPCMHLCSYAKHTDAVPDKNVQFWSHLYITLHYICSSDQSTLFQS